MSRASNGEPQSKRRKVRKGTRSCWECKRRKVRCEFVSPRDTLCIECSRRDLCCISQEYPEDTLPTQLADSQPEDQDNRIETMVKELTKLVNTHIKSICPTGPKEPSITPLPFEIPIPSSCNSDFALHSQLLTNSKDQSVAEAQGSSPSRAAERHENLSKKLHAALPSLHDIKTICRAGSRMSVYLTEHMRISSAEMDKRGMENSREKLLDIPESNAHPVLLGKYMLSLATFLQYLPPDQNSIEDLSEPPLVMMKRLADFAISLVSTNDSILDSVEAVECTIMEAVFQANIGNLRQAWLATQRSMSLARLMGIDKQGSHQALKFLDPRNPTLDRQAMWFRIVYLDRFLCLMLGLAPGSLENSFANDTALAGDTPMGKLECIHCLLTFRVLQRNENRNSDRYHKITEEIETDLQKAADLLPAKWWLAPNLANADEEAAFQETIRMKHQLYHYNLLNHLYLPYMLHSRPLMNIAAQNRYEYSKLTCVSASREVLSRFVIYRNVNRIPFCCRSVDFFALLAAMILLLAHIGTDTDECCSGPFRNLLAHQRLSDRAIIEQAIESMEVVGRLNQDTLSEKSTEQIRRLFDIEAEVAAGKIYTVGPSPCSTAGHAPQPDQQRVLNLEIPCYGPVLISKHGNSSDNSRNRHLHQPQTHMQPPIAVATSIHSVRSHVNRVVCQEQSLAAENEVSLRHSGSNNWGLGASIASISNAVGSRIASQRSADIGGDNLGTSDVLSSSGRDAAIKFNPPNPTDDLQFHSVAFNFFDSLTRGSDMEGIGDGSLNRSAL